MKFSGRSSLMDCSVEVLNFKMHQITGYPLISFSSLSHWFSSLSSHWSLLSSIPFQSNLILLLLYDLIPFLYEIKSLLFCQFHLFPLLNGWHCLSWLLYSQKGDNFGCSFYLLEVVLGTKDWMFGQHSFYHYIHYISHICYPVEYSTDYFEIHTFYSSYSLFIPANDL